LQDQLREAIEKEDYERAAKLRDEINRRKGSNN
jgi:protein-arginine kinase activator protein McsA